MKTRVLVVIPHRNGADLLAEALSALAEALDANRDHVVVVDNGSTDDSVARVRRLAGAVTVLEAGANLGFGRACNLGFRARDSEFVLFLNNDCRLSRVALERLLAELAVRPSAAVVGPQLIGADGQPQRSAAYLPTLHGEMGFARRRFPASAPGSEALTVPALVGASMLCRRSALEAVAGFDEGFFFYFEEVDLCRRFVLQGFDVVLVPSARVIHGKGVATRAVRAGAQMEMLRSRFHYYWQAFPKPLALWLVIFRTLRLLVSTSLHVVLLLVTLGCHKGTRMRTGLYLRLVLFLLCGMPKNQGLPGKAAE